MNYYMIYYIELATCGFKFKTMLRKGSEDKRSAVYNSSLEDSGESSTDSEDRLDTSQQVTTPPRKISTSPSVVNRITNKYFNQVNNNLFIYYFIYLFIISFIYLLFHLFIYYFTLFSVY